MRSSHFFVHIMLAESYNTHLLFKYITKLFLYLNWSSYSYWRQKYKAFIFVHFVCYFIFCIQILYEHNKCRIAVMESDGYFFKPNLAIQILKILKSEKYII